MPKRTRSGPGQGASSASASMARGQAFRRSSTAAKKQKTDDEKATKTATVNDSKNGKGKGIGLAEGEAGSYSAKPKSILKPDGSNGKQKLKSIQEDNHGTLVKQTPSVTAQGKKKVSGSQNTQTSNKRAKASTMAAHQPVSPPRLPKSFRIVVGSYERMLFGFHVKLHAAESEIEPDHNDLPSYRVTFAPMFSFAAHTSCISAVAAAGSDSKWLATGAGDETVRVWDLRKRKEVGGLTGHGGTIHSLSFPMRTYLLSADSSGLINLYRTRDWALLKTLRGHTGRVNACKAHSSGKVALSVGQDGMLRMWDLMRGKGSGAVRLRLGQSEDAEMSASKFIPKQEPLDVEWSPNGKLFLVYAKTEVAVYTTAMQKVASVLVRHDDPKNKFCCVSWLSDSLILCGTESGVVDVYALNDNEDEEDASSSFVGPICKLVGHTNRVKSVRVIDVKPNGDGDDDLRHLAISASTDGKLRVFDVTRIFAAEYKTIPAQLPELAPIGTHDTGGARLTCLDVVGGAGVRTAAADTIETDVEQDMDDDDDGEDDDGDDASSNDGLDADEMEELNELLDIIEQARAEGIDVEGMDDLDLLAAGNGEEYDDGDDDDDDEGDDDFSEEDIDEAIEEEDEDLSEVEDESEEA